MPLSKSSLTNGFQDLFEGKDPAAPGEMVFPPNPTEAGKKWAAVYKKYAEGAQAGATQPLAPSLIAAENTLAGALAAGFTAAKAAPPPAAIAALAASMDLAFVAFWMTPPMAFAATPPTMAGVVSLAPPGILLASLIALFTSGAADKKTAAQQADAMATLLDSWTKTVMVLNTPVTPPGPPLPPVPLA